MLPGIVESLIILDAQFIGADFAEDGFLIEFGFLPNQWLLVSFFFLAEKTGIIFVTAFELNGNGVELGVPINKVCLIVHWLA